MDSPARGAQGKDAEMINVTDMLGGAKRYFLYHGSRAKDEILKSGFDIGATRAADPGDFGWGIYFTANLSRAKAQAGRQNVLDVIVEFDKPLTLHSPYSVDPAEVAGDYFIADLRERFGDTVHGTFEERVRASKAWAREIQRAGYDAVVWEKPYLRGPIEENYEVVIFNPKQIISARSHQY